MKFWKIFWLFPLLAWAQKNQDYFSVSELKVDGKLVDYLAKDLNHDNKLDILVTYEGSNHERMVGIFYQSEQGFPADPNQSWIMDDRIIVFDIGNVVGDERKEIVCFLEDGLYYYENQNNHYNTTLKKSLDIRSIFVLPNKNELDHWNFVRDINDDKADEIIVPQFDGYSILKRNPENTYTLMAKIDAPILGNVYTSSYRIGESVNSNFSSSKLLFQDYNRDGRSDIEVLDHDDLYLFFQNGSGDFSNQPNKKIKLNIEDEKRGLRLHVGRDDENEKEQIEITKIADLNNDGLFDIIAQKISTKESVLNPTSQIQIHLGKEVEPGSGAIFEKTPSQILTSEGLQVGTEILDLNADQRQDLVIPTIKLGVLKIIRMLLTRRATMDVMIYRMNADGRYSDRPDYTKDLTMEFSFSGGGNSIPVNEMNDYNGDGIVDLLTSKSKDELNIFYGTNSKELFHDDPDVEFQVKLPKNGNLVKPISLNEDKKMDLVIRYGKQDDEKGELRNTLKILIAR